VSFHDGKLLSAEFEPLHDEHGVKMALISVEIALRVHLHDGLELPHLGVELMRLKWG